MLEDTINELTAAGRTGENGPSLLLHACCAPCSSHVLCYLSGIFRITVFFFNPNITENSEYEYRIAEEKRLIGALNERYKGAPGFNPIEIIEGEYCPESFFSAVKGLEAEPEGGKRCTVCFEQRLSETAHIAAERGFEYMTTTLSISPLKDEQRLNRIGSACAEKNGVKYLYSDFKKKDGYKHSIELSGEYNLYRQDYCGCCFSKAEAERRRR